MIDWLKASDAAKAPITGRKVPQKIGSPTPARGPIIPTLTPWIAWSSMTVPFAFSSSMAKVTPKIGASTYG